MEKEKENEYVKLVSDFVKIPIETIRSKWRKREVCEARQLISYINLLYTKLTLRKIADLSNYGSHASVLRDRKQVLILMETNKAFALKYNPLLNAAKELADKLAGKISPLNIEKGDICWFWNDSQPYPLLGKLKSFRIDHDNNFWFRRTEEPELDYSHCKYTGAQILPEGFKLPVLTEQNKLNTDVDIFYEESLIEPETCNSSVTT